MIPEFPGNCHRAQGAGGGCLIDLVPP